MGAHGLRKQLVTSFRIVPTPIPRTIFPSKNVEQNRESVGSPFRTNPVKLQWEDHVNKNRQHSFSNNKQKFILVHLVRMTNSKNISIDSINRLLYQLFRVTNLLLWSGCFQLKLTCWTSKTIHFSNVYSQDIRTLQINLSLNQTLNQYQQKY